MRRSTDLLIIGGGCAGMAAALAAKEHGIRDVLILERSPAMGGVLHQCIHNGFGIHTFGEDLTGTEFGARYIRLVREAGIECLTGTIALEVRKDRSVLAMRRGELITISAGAISVFCAVAGLLISILAETPVGATIVAVDLLAFLVCSAVGSVKA